MSQDYKLRYDQIREGDPTKSNTPAPSKKDESMEVYQTASHARNLCLVWLDGKRMFFNYAYLVSGEYSANSEKNIILLHFSSYSVQLQGYGLESVFMSILDHSPKIITMIDERYVVDSPDSVVIDIHVEKKNE
ncbi:hypothetical protein VB264_21115 [Arcicella aquatica]|uniref:Uncharacterized protein n=1 Tax=Arcicella aquatica TaxID=217141 RepID=A0ABU5QTG6_9BACT|nr:hypothetical protein [Arcicella aquatica]MEA5260313.1 hypothetical protein [Arcicella aquatica]